MIRPLGERLIDPLDVPERLRRLHAREHLGWDDLLADTRPREWKFNIWRFHDPTAGEDSWARTLVRRVRQDGSDRQK